MRMLTSRRVRRTRVCVYRLISGVGLAVILILVLYPVENERERINLSETAFKNIESVQIRNGFVFLQMINAAYIPMTLNWICGVSTSVLEKCVFLATDTIAAEKLKELQMNVLHQNMNSVELRFGTRDYYLYMLQRTKIVEQLLERGINTWIIESDATWLHDPSNELVKYQNYDVIAGHDGTLVDINPQPQAGFIFLNATERTLRLWRHIRRRQEIQLRIFRFFRTRMAGNEMLILRKQLHMVRWTLFDSRTFVSGLWYTDEYTRSQTNPFVIQNNWLAGNNAKIERAKLWAHWFLDSNGECRGKRSSPLTLS